MIAATPARTTVLIAMIAALLLLLVGHAAEAKCLTTDIVGGGPCDDSYASCVSFLITSLRDQTPKVDGFQHDQYSFPDGSVGSVTGAASCSPNKDKQHCESCLAKAKTSLDRCKDSGGIVNNDDCTMWFDQIR
ncbi:unnamed protein product [Linum trigynum]|uniref:Gnk2-homologous domain-containing protein n=1 Tax=Linum trigynum TaxID=586398 RepID=A0AAV2GEH1_9ROSI